MPINHAAADVWEATIAAERAGLVRLCRHLSGDAEAAEELAQETLLEAWRHLQRLQDPEGSARWLAAIARNVCLRWQRRRGREMAGRAPLRQGDNPEGFDLADTRADDVDFDVELERAELADLLDRALGLLPPDTRRVLIERYVRESPLADVAARLGLSLPATAKKLQRGKLAFRRVLATHFHDELAAYGFLSAAGATWQQTHIWCPWCGQVRLLGRFAGTRTTLELRCPNCCREPGAQVASASRPNLFRGVQGYRAAYSRLLAWSDRYFAAGLDHGALPCPGCERPTPVRVDRPAEAGMGGWSRPGLHMRCAVCGNGFDYTLSGRLLALPEVRRFWQAHPRMRLLPARLVEAVGSPALVMGFADVAGRASIDVLCACDTLAVLSIDGASRAVCGENAPR